MGHDDKYLPGYLRAAEAPTVSAKVPVATVYALCGSARAGKLDLINFVSVNDVFIILNCVLACAHTPHHSRKRAHSTSPSARACRHGGKVTVVARPPVSELV